MTAHEYMKKYLRKVSRGGIAWERRVFTTTSSFDPQELLDAAVDIAWERLMPNSLERPALDVGTRGSLIIFRIKEISLTQVLRQAA